MNCNYLGTEFKEKLVFTTVVVCMYFKILNDHRFNGIGNHQLTLSTFYYVSVKKVIKQKYRFAKHKIMLYCHCR